MNVIISGRHFEVTPEMKANIETRVANIFEGKHLKVTSVRVVLDLEKSRSLAEIIVNMKNNDFEAKSETYDMNESIDDVFEKLEKQVRKHLDKVQDHHRGESIKAIEPLEPAEVEE